MVRVLLLAVVLLFFAADASAYKKNYSKKIGSEFVKFVCQLSKNIRLTL